MEVVNLDPANDDTPYTCSINAEELITVKDAMEAHSLGPNGALMYCAEYLEANTDWLIEKIRSVAKRNVEQGAKATYFIFDCAGQIELYSHHTSFRNILRRLEKEFESRLLCVNLIDACCCSEPSRFVSAVLVSLATMLNLELPHCNVLSKVDLLQSDSNLEMFTEVTDLRYLLGLAQDGSDENEESQSALQAKAKQKKCKYARLNEAICSVIEDYSLVSFVPLNINDTASLVALAKYLDKINSYPVCYNDKERALFDSSV